MIPKEIDCQNAVLVRLYDVKNEKEIRSFWTQNPEMFLKTYFFIQTNGMDIDIDHEGNDEDPYNDTVGTITDISFSTGGRNDFSCIKIYLEVRDYK